MASTGHVYTVLLGAQRQTTSGFFNLFYPAGGYVTIVRDLVIDHHGQAAALFVVEWVYQGLQYGLVRSTVNANSSAHFDMRQVVPVGSWAQVYTDSSDWAVVCTGYQLSSSPGAALLPASDTAVTPQLGAKNT